MAGQKFKSARAIAVEVLNRCDPKKSFAGAILGKMQHQTDQSQRATDLVFGTLRNRTAIDAVISAFSGRPVERIQAGLLNIIRIGTYELLYCPSTEQYAVVNEAVASAKTTGGAKQSGFVNAVLRQITRHISNRRVPLAQGDAGCILPQSPATGCQFDASFLPDHRKSPAEYLSTAFSLPEWLIAGWLADPCLRRDDVTPAKAGVGEESTWRVCLASNRRPSVYVRPNRLKTTIEALTEKLADAEIEFEIAGVTKMLRIKSPRDVKQLPGFVDGQFTVQDITASQVVKMLNPQQGWTILDLCAAPGTKTTQLAEATGDSAKIIATDIDNKRLEMVKENIARLGIKSVDVVPYEELPGIADPCLRRDDVTPAKAGVEIENRKSKIENSFDCILLDVPCSNTGVLAKRIEVRYRIGPEAVQELARIQAGLLRTAADLLKPGGKICYSTCSIQKAENSELIEDFLKENKNFTLVSQQLTLPEAEGFDHDGGFAAILAKCKT
jgi:16S rRNA (cytosine967-C5)-methyltransferase